MTEINKLENELKKFSKNNYLLSDNGRGERTYVIRSEELKQSLQNIVHAGASNEEWRIEFAVGQNTIEYTMEKDGKFGLYRKSLDGSSPDEFSVLNISQMQNAFPSQIAEKREKFLQSVKEIEESRKRVEESRQRIKNDHPQLGSNLGDEGQVSHLFRKNERGQWIREDKEFYNDPAQEQIIKNSPGYKLNQELFSKWADQGLFSSVSRDTDRQQKRIEDSKKDNKREDFIQRQQIPPKNR